ncbi:MAG: restriction endonuclease subunit S [Candidatus Altiarchaeota archaeon]|nr:restriction endonuclease subunit S [Candidatus Altiarchaeota archaeon]
MIQQKEPELIPKWEKIKLGDISIDFIGGGTPSTSHKEYWKGNIPWMKSSHISSVYITQGQEHITEEGLKNSSTKIVPKDNLLVATRVGIGKVAINSIDIAISQDLTGIIINKEKTTPEYVYWVLANNPEKLRSLSQGSTIKGLLKDDLSRFEIALPPLPEQKKIAEVLSTVDSAIQKSDEAINKTERLKQGLMHKLLTGGIGHTEYKDTEIGRIPKEWDIVKVKDVTDIRKGKTTTDFEKVAFIPMDKISEISIHPEYEIKNKKDVKSFTYCEVGDLLIAKITPSLENGKQGIVPDGIPNNFALATTEVFPLACTDVDNLFLYYLLKHDRYRNKIISSMIGSTGRQRASKESLTNLDMPLPPFSEQKKITEILFTIDKKLELERSRKAGLGRVKKGLMDVLLSGKRRMEVPSNGST